MSIYWRSLICALEWLYHDQRSWTLIGHGSCKRRGRSVDHVTRSAVAEKYSTFETVTILLNTTRCPNSARTVSTGRSCLRLLSTASVVYFPMLWIIAGKANSDSSDKHRFLHEPYPGTVHNLAGYRLIAFYLEPLCAAFTFKRLLWRLL